MDTLRFISTPEQSAKLNDHLLDSGTGTRSIRGLEVEMVSLQVIKSICQRCDVDFELIGADVFLATLPQQGVSLLLDADVEPIVYSDFWQPPLHVDGQQINGIVSDKYRVYRMLQGIKGLRQPKTIPIHNHHDVQSALDDIDTDRVVVKPRTNGHSSRNVLMMDKQRLTGLKDGELLNFCDCVIQEYLPESLWPPKEWRLHFVGRRLCRCIRIVDKNNWSSAFQIQDIVLGDMPEDLRVVAEKVAAVLVNNRSKDNFTLDFLETENGFLFLEANCGALGSFYVDSVENMRFLENIFLTLFRLYFKKRLLT